VGGAISKDVLEDLEREQAAKEAAALADPGSIIERPEVDVPYPSREVVPQVEKDPQMVEHQGTIIDPSIGEIAKDAEPEFETTGEVETVETTVEPRSTDVAEVPFGEDVAEVPFGEKLEELPQDEPGSTDVANTSPNKLVEFFRGVIADEQDFREGRMKDPDYRKYDERYSQNWDVPTSTTEGIHFRMKDGSNLSVVPTENENEARIKELYQTHQTRETEWGTLEGVDRDTSTADRIVHLQQIARMADKTGTTLVAEIDPDLVFFRSQGHKYFAPIPQADYLRDAYKGLDDPTIDGWEFVDNWPSNMTVIKRKPQPFDAELDMPVTKKEEIIQRQKDWKEGGEQEWQEREQRIAEEERAAAAEKAAALADPGPVTYESKIPQRSRGDALNIRDHALRNLTVTGGSRDSEVNQVVSLIPRRSYYFKTVPFRGGTESGIKPDQNSFWYRGFPVHRVTVGSMGTDKHYTIYAPDNRTLVFQGYTTKDTPPDVKWLDSNYLGGDKYADLIKSRKDIKKIIDEYWTSYDLSGGKDDTVITELGDKSIGEDYTRGQFEADMKALGLHDFLEAPHNIDVLGYHAGGLVESSVLAKANPLIMYN
jgi:hypothetical protein